MPRARERHQPKGQLPTSIPLQSESAVRCSQHVGPLKPAARHVCRVCQQKGLLR